jgi:hypothetical protein
MKTLLCDNLAQAPNGGTAANRDMPGSVEHSSQRPAGMRRLPDQSRYRAVAPQVAFILGAVTLTILPSIPEKS